MPSLSPRGRLLGDHFHTFEGNFKVACLFGEQSFPFEKKKWKVMILAIYAIQENEDHPVFLFSLLGFCSTTRWWRWTSPGNYKESLGELACLCHWGWIWTKSANYIFPHPIHIIEYTQLQEIQGSDSWLQGGKRTFPWISKVSTKITWSL